MRLTLRTLLAYLDDTLAPEDAAVLRNKLSESGVATQLVGQIRELLGRTDLSAPSPIAAHPIEDANVVSEYLDSTLTAEQVAELERALLASEPHLAEVAACHQILTMVLGKPADVSPELRQRIYASPQHLHDTPATDSYSSLQMDGGVAASNNGTGIDSAVTAALGAAGVPAADSQAAASDDAVSDNPEDAATAVAAGTPDGGSLAAENSAAALEGGVVEPVGRTDSGVTDAASRIRQREAAGGYSYDPLLTEESSFRPTRIVSWLVSASLFAILLFALTKVFIAPLLDQRVAENQTPEPPVGVGDDGEGVEVISPGDRTPDGELADDGELAGDELMPTRQADSLPAPSGSSSLVDSAESVMEPADTEAIAAGETDSLAEAAGGADAPDGAVETKPPVQEDVAPMLPPKPEQDLAGQSAGESPNATAPVQQDDTLQPREGEITPAQKGDAMTPLPPASLAKIPDAILGPTPSLLIAIDDSGQATRVQAGDRVPLRTRLIVPPKFRVEIQIGDSVTWTLVGPGKISLQPDDGLLVLEQISGRSLLQPRRDGVNVPLAIGPRLLAAHFEKADSLIACESIWKRAPGQPLDQPNRLPLARILAVQGEMDFAAGGIDAVALKNGDQFQWFGRQPPTVGRAGLIPPWIRSDAPVGNDGLLDQSAREGLLLQIEQDRPLELSLREAADFRRPEVAALAAQTLLELGDAEYFFSSEGVLNRPKQMLYFKSHIAALADEVNESPQRAAELLADIAKMDSASIREIEKLLTGFSQVELENGGDEKLVGWLESPTMSVRALAIDQLEAITGVTLGYRGDMEPKARREPYVKKWRARLRKGDIRWPENVQSINQEMASAELIPVIGAREEPESTPPESADSTPADATKE
ncbi:MAG: hypothetical protein AAF958_17490 [Planctomycetota bacterium]